MIRTELIELLSDSFQEDFADDTSSVVVTQDCVELLYELAVGTGEFKKSQQAKIIFRAAYVLETIYFNYPEKFTEKLRQRFWDDFSVTVNESAKRHFGKIMKSMLQQEIPSEDQCSRIAEACVVWLTEPRTRVAVKIHAIEILLILRNRVDWLPELMQDMIEQLRADPTPAMQVCLRKIRCRPNSV